MTEKSKTTKKAYTMPASVAAKVAANAKFKSDIFSASGLVKWAKSPTGAKIIAPYLEIINAKHKTNFRVEKIDTRLWKLGTERELKTKDGQARKLFSFWTLLNLVARKCKQMSSAAIVPAPAPAKVSEPKARAKKVA